MNETQDMLAAQAVVTDIWERASRSPGVELYLGRTITALPHLTLEAAEADAAFARHMLERLSRIRDDLLPHDLALTVKVARFQMTYQAKAADWYWLAGSYDGSFPGPFQVSAYAFGPLLVFLQQVFASHAFADQSDCDRYLALIGDFARLLDEMRGKLQAQAQRGIRIHQPAFALTRSNLLQQRSRIGAMCKVADDRLAGLPDAASFLLDLENRIAHRLVPAFGRLLAVLDDDYAAKAPEGVGMRELPGGLEIYHELVRYHLTADLSPDDVHRMGLDRVAALESDMREIAAGLGFQGKAAFRRHLVEHSYCAARSADEIAARLTHHMTRFEPLVDKLFNFHPRQQCGVAALSPDLADGMTFGFYHPPSPTHPQGIYYYNGARPEECSLATMASLVYHELVPGHHFHIASQYENPMLHPLRKFATFNAYNEGWAEYAATLAGEMGLYDNPYDRYGRAMMQALLATRLVVDTGMNALGWSLEKARAYMAEHTPFSRGEIESESLRYSCGIPAQALAYKLGDERMLEFRGAMQRDLGDKFDVRDFHDAALRPGALPFDVLAWRIKEYTAALKDGRKLV